MITGIICEFNPFHQGHKYLIDSAKKHSDGVVCVMSGNFVQRGEFAVYDKFTRAKKSLENGADLIIELPCAYSLMSAKGFAKYAGQILRGCGVVDSITFGAECDNAAKLKAAADKIKENDGIIKEMLKEGISYPAARKAAVNDPVLDTPNNILAIEYISEIDLPFYPVKRIGKGHDSDDELYSASQIRKSLDENEISSLKNCEKAVLAKLRTMTEDDFLEIDDVSEGLENRIVQAVRSSTSLEEIYDKIKTKRYTHSRIRRIILKSYLGITSRYTRDVPYIRILGFNDRGREILNKMTKKASLPVISRYADIKNLTPFGKELFELECRCTDLYNLGYKNPLPCGTEQRSKIATV